MYGSLRISNYPQQDFSTIAIGHFHLQFYPEVDTAKVLATAYMSRVQALKKRKRKKNVQIAIFVIFLKYGTLTIGFNINDQTSREENVGQSAIPFS